MVCTEAARSVYAHQQGNIGFSGLLGKNRDGARWCNMPVSRVANGETFISGSLSTQPVDNLVDNLWLRG